MKFNEMKYSRVGKDDFVEKIDKLILEFKEAKTAEEEYVVHEKVTEELIELETMNTLASIRNSIDTSDEFYDEEMKYYYENMPIMDEKVQQYQKLVLESEHRDYFEKKLGKVAFKNAEIEQKAFNEKINLNTKKLPSVISNTRQFCFIRLFYFSSNRNQIICYTVGNVGNFLIIERRRVDFLTLHTCTCGYKLTDDNIFLKTE